MISYRRADLLHEYFLPFQNGDRVRMTPEYVAHLVEMGHAHDFFANLQGTVVDINGPYKGSVKVRWDSDKIMDDVIETKRIIKANLKRADLLEQFQPSEWIGKPIRYFMAMKPGLSDELVEKEFNLRGKTVIITDHGAQIPKDECCLRDDIVYPVSELTMGIVKGYPVFVMPANTNWGKIQEIRDGLIITNTHSIDYINWALIIDNGRIEIRQ